MPRMSYSRVGCFKKCPYQYFLRYIKQLDVLKAPDAADPLIVGNAMHHAIEQGTDAAINDYHKEFFISEDTHIAEEIKIRALAPKVVEQLPPGGTFELKLEEENFLGFIDYAAPDNKGGYTLYDFKYTNPKNAKRYEESEQLQVYAYYFEKLGFGRVNDLCYIIVPKTRIYQKKAETVIQYRNRLRDTLAKMEPFFVWVPYDREKVIKYFEDVVETVTATEYPKEITRLCDWCDYQTYCESEGKETTMLLPKAERRDISQLDHVKIWIYGEPFTGKTTFANQFPAPLMLNTDGNIKYVDAPYISLRDTVEKDGRLTKTVHGWETLKEAVEELEKGSDFETVILDLTEGAYELNRSYIYDKYGWEHESDDSFRAWDIVRKEFFDVLRRLTNLPMNVVLISHEDTTRDFTKRGGDKISAVKPNIQDKVAKVLAGMVDLVGRAVVRDDEHFLDFKTDEFIFGGGRLKLDTDEIALNFDAFCNLLNWQPCETVANTDTTEESEEPPFEPDQEETRPEQPEPQEEIPEDKPRPRRGRPRKAETAAAAPQSDETAETEQTPAEDQKPVKRTRKRRVKSEG